MNRQTFKHSIAQYPRVNTHRESRAQLLQPNTLAVTENVPKVLRSWTARHYMEWYIHALLDDFKGYQSID